MKYWKQVFTAAVLLGTAASLHAQKSAGDTSATLDIYFVDTEGGQATLMVTPSGETFLFDAGFPGAGRFNSPIGNPAEARDPQRIFAVASTAGVKQIDHLIISHYHGDHFGGVMELAQLMPIHEYIDHAPPSLLADSVVPGTIALHEAYVALRSKARHIQPKAGDRLRYRDVTMDVLATDGQPTTKALPGGGRRNQACTTGGVPPQEPTENPMSTAVVVTFGEFRFMNPGDLTGPALYALSCPTDLIGPLSVYLVAHHGGADGSDISLFAASKPLVAVFGNGQRKGAQPATFRTLEAVGDIDAWQLHRTVYEDAINAPDAHIANLDTSTTAWIKISASRDGSFSVTNGRTGETKFYSR